MRAARVSRWSRRSWSSSRAASPATARERALVPRVLPGGVPEALFVRARTIGARGGLCPGGPRPRPGRAGARSLLRKRTASARARRDRRRSAPAVAARAARGLRRDARAPPAQCLARRGGEPLFFLRLSRVRRGGSARAARDRARAASVGRALSRPPEPRTRAGRIRSFPPARRRGRHAGGRAAPLRCARWPPHHLVRDGFSLGRAVRIGRAFAAPLHPHRIVEAARPRRPAPGTD